MCKNLILFLTLLITAYCAWTLYNLDQLNKSLLNIRKNKTLDRKININKFKQLSIKENKIKKLQ